MAIIYYAGFENHGNDAADKERYNVSNGLVISDTMPPGGAAGKYGGYAMRVNVSAAGTEFLDLPTTRTAGRVVKWFREGNDGGTTNNGVLRVNNGSNLAFALYQNGSGFFELRTSAGLIATSSLNTGGTSSQPSQYYHLDISWDLTAGQFDLVINGNSEISTTFTPDQSVWDRLITRGATNGFLAGGDYVIRDDIVVEDGSSPASLSEHRVFHILPSGDVSKEWSPNTGTFNYAMVDDTDPDQLTTYVESTAVDDRDVYSHSSTNVGTIKAVQVKALCTNGGNIRLGLTDGTNEDISSNIAVDASLWKEAYYVAELAPDGGAWSQAKLDDVDIIVEASASGVQVTQVQLEVLSTITGPATPTLFLDNAGEDFVTMHTSDFSGTSSPTHTASQWQITNSDDTSFSSPVYNPGDDVTNLTSITVTGLDPAKTYIARARHKDDNPLYSDWSNTISFSTIPVDLGLYYFPVKIGDTVTLAAEFVKENASDTTTADVRMPLYTSSKVRIPGLGDPDRLTWTSGEDGSRKQTKFTITNIFINVTEGWRTPAWIGAQIDATGDTGHTSGFNYCCAWLNAPDFGLQANLTLASNDVTLAWTSEIPCRVKYIANTTGYTTLQDVYENGTFTGVSDATSDSDVVYSGLGFGETMYITFVAFDEDGKRNGVLQTRSYVNELVVSTTQDPAGATPDVDWALGPQHTLVLDQNCAPTFSNPVLGKTYTLIIQQDGTGGWTFTWPSSVKVSGGSLPTVTSTAGAEDTYSLYCAGVTPSQVYYLTTVCQDCS